jgi:hypothetical protein
MKKSKTKKKASKPVKTDVEDVPPKIEEKDFGTIVILQKPNSQLGKSVKRFSLKRRSYSFGR